MRPRVPPANHLDVVDISLAAAAWEQGVWNRPLRTELRWESESRTNVMAGGADAVDAVRALEFSSEILDMLRDLDCLSHLGEDFWRFLEGQRFNGKIQVLPEGTRFHPSKAYAAISGGVGEILLFRSTFDYVLAFQVGKATAFAEAHAAASATAPHTTKVQVVDDASRWSVGHGWSLWEANAAAAGGARPLKLELGVLSVFAGDELFLQNREP